MSTLIVGEVNAILYAFGIPNKKITKIILVEICPELKRMGARPFSESLKLAKLIAAILEIDFETYATSDSEFIYKLIDADSIVDTSIISYFKVDKKGRKGCKILTASIEHSFINSPSIYFGLTPGLKKRIDLTRKIFFPLKIFSMYSLGGPNKKLSPIKLESINFEIFYKNSKYLFPRILGTLDDEGGGFSHRLGDPTVDKTLFILPRPKEIGGSDALNVKIICEAITHAKKYNFGQIIIKNHPMDEFDYSRLLFDSSIPILYLNRSTERMIPLELLIHYYKNFSFYGSFSTVFYTLSRFLCEVPHIYLPTDYPLEIYAISSIMPYVQHVPHYLKWNQAE